MKSLSPEHSMLLAANRRGLVSRVTVIALLSSSLLSACTASKWREVSETPQGPTTHTGDEIAERRTVPTRAEDLRPGTPGFVAPDRLRGRETPEQPGEEAPVVLERGDRVEVIDPTPRGPDGLIRVRVIQTANPPPPVEPPPVVQQPVQQPPAQPEPPPVVLQPAQQPAPQPVPPVLPPIEVYVPPQYISPDPIFDTPEQRDADRYFMIQNIATEKVRVYERCDTQANIDCVHKLILETDMTAGENTPDRTRRTKLGSYRITRWFKFYEDNLNLFPSWYAPNYPQLPPPGADLAAWTSSTLLPNGRGSIRGSFGWYTAHIGPNADAQWTHGTLGWGADGGKFIHISREAITNLYSDARSHGCTRVENQAIAFLREVLPVGTKLVKIYAKEAYRDAARTRYQARPKSRWSWSLTNEGVDIDGPKSGRAGVVARQVPSENILESGTYEVDHMPDAVPFVQGTNGHINANGNLYDIPEASLRGFLIVDEGRLTNYRHPSELGVGGHSDRQLPSVVISRDSNVVVPPPTSPPAAPTSAPAPVQVTAPAAPVPPAAPVALPESAPVAPVPVAPVPVAPAPVTPTPVAPPASAPVVTVEPVTPAPVTPAPVAADVAPPVELVEEQLGSSSSETAGNSHAVTVGEEVSPLISPRIR